VKETVVKRRRSLVDFVVAYSGSQYIQLIWDAALTRRSRPRILKITMSISSE